MKTMLEQKLAEAGCVKSKVHACVIYSNRSSQDLM